MRLRAWTVSVSPQHFPPIICIPGHENSAILVRATAPRMSYLRQFYRSLKVGLTFVLVESCPAMKPSLYS